MRRAAEALTAYGYYMNSIPSVMAEMTRHFYSEGVRIYGFRPELYIKNYEKGVYVALYFEYIIGADRRCQKTYQIPQFQDQPHHITLFQGTDVHEVPMQALEKLQDLLKEEIRRDNLWLPVARWQKPNPTYAPTQFLFKGSELRRNIRKYLNLPEYDRTLHEILPTGDSDYHISL